MSDEWTLHPIGLVRNDVAGLDADWEGITSQIVIDEVWAPALTGLEEFSHVVVLTWLHRQPRRSPEDPLTHPENRADLPAVGFFATRSPRRANPIGLTVVPLLGRAGNVLTVQGLDMADGTPVLDLKPYLERGDRIESPRSPAWVRQLWAEANSKAHPQGAAPSPKPTHRGLRQAQSPPTGGCAKPKGRVVLAITGASGVGYGLRLAEALAHHELHFVVTQAAMTVMAHEVGDPSTVLADLDRLGRRYAETDLDAPPASGSFDVDAMVVCPCSMKTLAAVAHGYAYNLVARAADVTLKEGRPLVLVPRETPLSAVHLENMLALARLGVRIVPAMPGFYHGPRTVDHLVDFVVGKVLDQLGLEHDLYRRWGQDDQA